MFDRDLTLVQTAPAVAQSTSELPPPAWQAELQQGADGAQAGRGEAHHPSPPLDLANREFTAGSDARSVVMPLR
jgi:hypothetical protein